MAPTTVTAWLFLLFCGIALSIWPPQQSPAQQISKTATVQPAQKDSLQKITLEIKKDIKSKFDSIQDEIKRIRDSRRPRYITRTHTRKINHYSVDTVMVFIDTCFAKQAPPLPPDTIYTTPAKKQTRIKQFFNKIFNHKKPREDYMKVIPNYY